MPEISSMADSDPAVAMGYWEQRLTPLPEIVSLPNDYGHASGRTYLAGQVTVDFPPELVTRLFSEKQLGAPFVACLGALQVLLWRLSGNPDPVVFVPGQPGHFEGKNIDTALLPIRAPISPEITVIDYARCLERVVLEAYKYQDASRSIWPGQPPLNAVQFRFAHNSEISETSESVANKSQQSRDFPDLSIVVTSNVERCSLRCSYNSSLFTETSIRSWMNCYCILLASMLTDQLQPVERLPLLDSETKNFLLRDCNSIEILPLPAQSIPELLATSFEAMPSEPAAEFYGLTYSRTRLTEKSDRLASWLIRHGIIPGALVGIYMDRSLEMLVAILAVMKAGAAYVPLDPRFPAKRLQQIIDETEVPILLTLSRHVEDLPEFDGIFLSLDSKANELAREPLRPLPHLSQQMLAYVIFTSGSTGKPKGVEITHGAVVNLLVDVQRRLHVGPKDRLLAVTTLAFDISVLELLLPLVSGGTVVIATQDDAADGLRLVELLADSQITMLQATPFTWRMLLDLGFELPPGFKILCGGEAWTPAMADKLLTAGGRLWNMYGPTETTVWSSITEVKRGGARITIGPPIANTRFYVLDERLQPLPPGAPGELFIAGLGLARGYFKRDDLTIEKFLPDPFVEGQRMYRTGDEVRQLPDGRIEFVGRLDHQVKLRGFRIELGEIEVAIGEQPEISNAVVVKSQDSFGESLLAGYYTAQNRVSPAQVQEWLQSRLPAYMVPTVLEQLEVFPLTPNGKIDRNALSITNRNLFTVEPDAKLFEVSDTNSSVQRQMLEIWTKIFQGEGIRSSTNFFDIGGDSLSLVRLQAMATRQFGVHLTMADITRHSTFGSLTTWVSEMREVAASSPPKRTANPRVLPVHSTEAGHPIFLLPQMMIFWPLAEELGEHQSVYALQLLDEDISPSMESASFEQLALLYCNLIRQVQPEGPYRLGGWCLWGLMAYEIARLLEEQGAEVELVMIMDAWAPGHWKRRSVVYRILMKAAYRIHRLRWIIGRLRYGSMEKRKQDVLRQIRSFAASSTSTLLPASMRTKNPDRESNRIEKLVADAAGAYQPKPIKSTIAVFKGEQQPRGPFIGEDLGWAQLIGRGVSVDTLPGNHSEIFDLPGARIMAARIREVLHS